MILRKGKLSMKHFLVVVMLLVAVGCSSAGRIDPDNPGVLRDYLFSVEPRNNGTYTIWLRHDDTGAYCTADAQIGERALVAVRSGSGLVVMTYRNRQAGDIENGRADEGGCASEGNKYNGVTVYKVLSLEVLSEE